MRLPVRSVSLRPTSTATVVSTWRRSICPDSANRTFGSVAVAFNQTAAGSTTLSFSTPIQVVAGNGPGAVAVADFNGDGAPDLAIADNLASDVAVLLNDEPTQPFVSGLSLQASVGNPSGVALGDLSGTGHADLVVATSPYSGGAVSVYQDMAPAGASTPTYQKVTDLPVGNTPWAVAIADFDGDGRQDIAAVNIDSDDLYIYQNTTPAGGAMELPLPGVGGSRWQLSVHAGGRRSQRRWQARSGGPISTDAR